ncbi:Exonuclease RNase T and DNA polymerase III [Hyella patelloides LEGE 07179]|uniref:Exonuclease RNase T and DNA polymerase III n=1 Tax=Hyella patelloides LEGE 07179 TaxID=945734 RepID=A0A563W299_9CYAN|nr:ATP-binding protein [Hyella patelloides]VEP17829.1 Exonuclease RNase T and DNA polymerase III [Hyella patelloides LEGE 07179]
MLKQNAEFTYQLYHKILENKELREVKNKPNPFGSSRVDTPFQNHPDLTSIYQNQFITLKTIITDIKSDRNHQTKGAVVIGEPGTGKTHLMMRLAKELLEHNRLLFIRQPNNPDAIIYHTYSRILESLVEKVPQSNYTQIEHLLANSFVKLISKNAIDSPSQKEQYILETTEENSLKIYYSLGAEGTQRKREYWQYIEKRTIEWWLNRYSAAGYSLEVIKGIIKFCSYSDPSYKRLVTRWLAADNLEEHELEKINLSNWNKEMSKEAFSLEAISVLSKLSLLDEPLIIVFDQLEGLGLKHNERLLLSFGEAIKEIFTHVPNSLIILNLFPDRWQQFQQIFDGSIIDRISQHQVTLEKLSQSELKQILQTKAQLVEVNIEALFTDKELSDILNHNSIRAVLNKAYDYYRSKVNDISLPARVTTKVSFSQEETVIDRLQNLENQVFQLQQVFQNIAQALTIFQGFEPEVKTEEKKQQNNTSKDTESQSATNNKNNKKISNTENKKESPEKQKFVNYIETEKEQLEHQYLLPQIIDDSDDIGKLKTIVEAFKTIKNLEIDHLRLGKRKLPEHLVIKKNSVNLCIGFLQISGGSFTTRIKNYNALVITHKDFRFVLWRDSRQTGISGKIGNEEIAKLNNASNGNFLTMGQENRINFELIYKLIVDIQNRDLDLPLETALPMLSSYLKNYWLIKSLL